MFEKRPKITVPQNSTDLWIDRISFLLFFLIIYINSTHLVFKNS